MPICAHSRMRERFALPSAMMIICAFCAHHHRLTQILRKIRLSASALVSNVRNACDSLRNVDASAKLKERRR